MEFFKVRAKSIMTTPVVRVVSTDKVSDAALLMSNNRISAVPVLCESGDCVGVLGGQDVIRYESIREETENEYRHGYFHNIARYGIEDAPPLSKIRFNQVEHHMNRNFVIAGPESTVKELSEKMCESHSHHAVILDEEANLVGIVSTLDILAFGIASNSESESATPLIRK